MTSRRVAAALLLLAGTLAGCGGGEKIIEPADGLAALLRVHDALAVAGGWDDTELSRLSIERRACADGDGVAMTVEWVGPTSDPDDPLRAPSATPTPDRPGVPPASVRVRHSMRDALNVLEPGDGHIGDDVWLLGVHAEFEDQADRVHVLDSTSTTVVSSVWTTLSSSCLRAVRPIEPDGAVDPVATLAAVRRDRAMPAEGWHNGRERSGTGPVGPDEALGRVDGMLSAVTDTLREGTAPVGTRAPALPSRQAWLDSGASREFDRRTVVRAVDRTGCSGTGLVRVVASVPLVKTPFAYSTEPAVVDAWRDVPGAPWNLAAWMEAEPPLPGLSPPATSTPPGPPILLGGVDPRGGVLLRGTAKDTVVQVVSPCAKFATDPVLAAALGV